MFTLKIGIASSGLGHIARGVEAWAADLGRALAERGEAVTLWKGGGDAEQRFERVVPCWQRDSIKTKSVLRVIPRFLGWRLGLGSAYAWEQATFALRLLPHLYRDKVDILHVQDPLVALLMQRAAALGLVRTRTILAHGTEESLSFQRKITYLQHLAPWHLEEARAAGVWKPTWTAIPNFIDADVFRPGRADALRAELGIPADAVVVLSAAAIKRGHKRIDYLLDEFAELLRRDPQSPLCLVVAGGREADTDELVEQGRARLGDRVRFLVRFPRSRMPDLYRMADVFTLCSLKEMMPIALIEACASGLPCLVNRHPVMQWMLGPGGEAIEMATGGALASALHGLLADSARRRRLGGLARRHCEEHFSQGPVIEQILAYYRSVLADGRPAGRGEPRVGLDRGALPGATAIAPRLVSAEVG
jgi:glycosyltransferase involved in cell wall biosynthesis